MVAVQWSNCWQKPIKKGNNFQHIFLLDSFCTHEYEPVCGDNGVTYSNVCNLKVAECILDRDIVVVKNNQCNAPEETENKEESAAEDPTTPQPVSPVTPPPGDTDADIFCEVTYTPVCGTDDVTYSNECNLRATAKLLGLDIDIKHKGRCQPSD